MSTPQEKSALTNKTNSLPNILMSEISQKEAKTPLDILKSNIETIKSEVVFDTILSETKTLRSENRNIRFLLSDAEDSIGLVNTTPQTKLNEFISTLLREKELFDSHINLLRVPKSKLSNQIVLEKVEEAVTIICGFKVIPFCTCKKQKLKILKQISEIAQEALGDLLIAYETTVKKIIRNFSPSTRGELKLHADFYQTLSGPLKFLQKIRAIISDREDLDVHTSECPIVIKTHISDSLLAIYIKTSADVYNSEFIRHFETLYDVIRNNKVKSGLNLNLLLESVLLIRDGEIEFIRSAFSLTGVQKDIKRRESSFLSVQDAIFTPVSDSIVQFIVDLYSEFKENILLMVWGVSRIVEDKYLLKISNKKSRSIIERSDNTSNERDAIEKSENASARHNFIEKLLKRLHDCYLNLLSLYFKSIHKKMKNRKKHRKAEILSDQIKKFDDPTVKKIFLTNLRSVILDMDKDGLEIFYEMEKEYIDAFTSEISDITRIFVTPPDKFPVEIYDLNEFQKEVEDTFDRAVRSGEEITSKNAKIQNRVKWLRKN